MKTESTVTGWFLFALAGAATIFLGFVFVLVSWHTLSLICKVDAIVFLFLLAVSPFREIFNYRRGRTPMGPHDGLIVGYLITILALISLARR